MMPIWIQVRKYPPKHRLAVAAYHDAEAAAIVRAASKLTVVPTQETLEAFGEFIAPDLLDMHKPPIDPSWKTADLSATLNSGLWVLPVTISPDLSESGVAHDPAYLRVRCFGGTAGS